MGDEWFRVGTNAGNRLAMSKVSDLWIESGDTETTEVSTTISLFRLVNDGAINTWLHASFNCDVSYLSRAVWKSNSINVDADHAPRIEIIALLCGEDLLDIRFQRVSPRVPPRKFLYDAEIISQQSCCKEYWFFRMNAMKLRIYRCREM